MKKLRIIPGFLFLLAVATSCTVEDGIDKDTSFLKTANTENLNALFDITNDNSGNVTVTPSAQGATSYTIDFGHGDPATVTPGMNATHSYPEGEYTVAITAQNVGGGETTEEFPLSVVYRAPENLSVSPGVDGYDVTISAEADYANSFTVYYGDVENEEGTPMAVGETLPPHTYAEDGIYNVRVVANSGGAATTETIVPVAVYVPFILPVDFENLYFFGTFGDGQGFETVENPDKSGINTSEMAGKFIRGNQFWSGTYSPLAEPIDFSQGQVITMMVYNPDPDNIGKKISMELEWPVGADSAQPYGAIVKMPVTKANEWEMISFDFSGIDTIPADAKFNQLVFRFNESTDVEAAGQVIYFDNITLTN